MPLAALQDITSVDPPPPGALQIAILTNPATPGALKINIVFDPAPPGALQSVMFADLADRYLNPTLPRAPERLWEDSRKAPERASCYASLARSNWETTRAP